MHERSSTFVSLLTKQDVLSVLSQPSYTNFEIQRMIGGRSFGERIHSALHWLGQKAQQLAPIAKNVLASSGNPYGQAASAALGALGYGHHKTLENRIAS